VGQTADGLAVWIRRLDSDDARPLPGTEGAAGRPFWSPDSGHLAFFAGGSLKRIELATSAVRVVADVAVNSPAADGTWSPDGTLLFSQGRGSGLRRVSANGGSPEDATTLSMDRGENGHYLPQFLADGSRFVYLVQSADPEVGGIYLGSLSGEAPVRLTDAMSPFAASSGGDLLFVLNQSLVAQELDTTTRKLVGIARPLTGIVDFNRGVNFLGNTLAVSRTGVLVFSQSVSVDQQFVWTDRAGREVGAAGEPAQLGNFDLSPNETQVVFQKVESGRSSIWTLDLKRGVSTRLTPQARNDSSPVWSPDGRQIAFSRGGGLGAQVAIIGANGGSERTITDLTGAGATAGGAQVDDWSPDGRFVTFNRDPALMAVPVDGGKPFAFVETNGNNVDESHFSHDGKWIAYNSNDSGTWQVYVAPFPPTGQRWQVSSTGGVDPRWRRDGRELYYLSLDGQMTAVEVDTSLTDRFEAGPPQLLFDARLNINPRADHYAVTGTGERFLLKRPVGRGSREPWTVVLNWPRLLAQR
jgi:Tol biopolymer transport system component